MVMYVLANDFDYDADADALVDEVTVYGVCMVYDCIFCLTFLCVVCVA